MIQVFCYPKGRGIYCGTLEIQTGVTASIPLSAEGFGKCIVFTPEIFPFLDLGPLYR